MHLCGCVGYRCSCGGVWLCDGKHQPHAIRLAFGANLGEDRRGVTVGDVTLGAPWGVDPRLVEGAVGQQTRRRVEVNLREEREVVVREA